MKGEVVKNGIRGNAGASKKTQATALASQIQDVGNNHVRPRRTRAKQGKDGTL
jgi:hypothetical protein